MTKKSLETPPWYSSYSQSNYGELFYSLIRIYKPGTVVELGTKAGYSAYHIAKGLKENGRGKLYCYDLWEKYEFNSVPLSLAKKNLNKFKNIVKLNQRDATNIDKLYKKIDILHVDLGNHGEILEKIIPKWLKKVQKLIVIEGGSLERDKYPWMVKYKKIPIISWIAKFKKKYNVEYITIEPFPSVTLIRARN